MNLEEFKKSLNESQPPEGLSGPLEALWWDAKENWQKAHETAQDVHNKEGSWVHAYLHRKEGDEWNAGYWYDRAGQPKSKLSLEQEWDEIVSTLLQ